MTATRAKQPRGTKTKRRALARAIRESLRQYDIWQLPHIIESHPETDVTEQRWDWLLAAQAELTELIGLEGQTDPPKWAGYLNKRSRR